jgi:hypothetical protein
MDRKIKILYLMGWGRSGSTILSNILGQLEGFLPVGEIRTIWKDGFRQNRICGCGKPFSECDFWTRVFEDFSRHSGRMEAEQWEKVCREETRSLSGPKYLLPRGWIPHSPAFQEYLSVTGMVYESLQRTSGCSVIVDISHSPFYGCLLGLLPGLDVYYVHLIRDPRATAFSWLVPKPQPGPHQMLRIGCIKSSMLWTMWNAVSEWMQRRNPERFFRIRYEDFIHQPRPSVEDLVRFIGENPSSLPFVSNNTVRLEPNHTLRGNPVRFQTGRIDLKEDLRWQALMKPADRWTTGFLTWPLAIGYGYFRNKRQSLGDEDSRRIRS